MSNFQNSIDLKREFILYFLNTYNLSVRESIWILNAIKKSPFLLEKISFVDSCKNSRIGITMKTRGESGFDLSYYADGRFISNDPTTIYRFFDSLSVNNNNALFDIPEIHIQLQFSKKDSDEYYLGIKKGFVESKNSNGFSFNAASEKEIDSFLFELQRKHLPFIFKKELDNALDLKDEKLFLEVLMQINDANIPLSEVAYCNLDNTPSSSFKKE